MIVIRPIQVPDEVPAARRLILEVARYVFEPDRPLEEAIAAYLKEGWLTDLDDINRSYFENRGTFLVTVDGERVIGTGAIRYLEPAICELKRIWLFPEYHGRGLGYRMVTRLIEIAREKEYQKMRLTTSAQYQQQAIRLYQRIGFQDAEMFLPDPDPDEVALEMDL